jgi:hypothetical protein
MLISEHQIKLGEDIADSMAYPLETYFWTKDICQCCGKKTMFKCENEATICAYCYFSPELECCVSY